MTPVVFRSLPATVVESERLLDNVVTGHELEQRLVDGAELLGAEVAVVDRLLGLTLGLDDGQAADGSNRASFGRRRVHEEPVGLVAVI